MHVSGNVSTWMRKGHAWSSVLVIQVTKQVGRLTGKGCTLREKKRGMIQSYLPRLACSQALAKEVTTWGWD